MIIYGQLLLLTICISKLCYIINHLYYCTFFLNVIVLNR